MTSTIDEITAFDAAVSGLLERSWGDATAAPEADVSGLWTAAVEQGWFELGPAQAIELALSAARQLGRVACPLPVVDAYVATEVLADTAFSGAVTDGSVRPVVVTGATGPYFVDAGGAATHVLLVPTSGGAAELRPIKGSTPLKGLAVPSWIHAEVGEPVITVTINQAQADRALTLTRLGLATRALAAAESAHEMAIEHAKTRVQFGRQIGTFGAVQQRTAQCQIEIRSANLLLSDAVDAIRRESADYVLSVEIAIAHIASVAPEVQLGAHHTLAATGYFEEHSAPWLFRRVHADVTILRTLELAQGTVADVLIESGSRLPASDLGEAGESFRNEYLEFIDGQDARDKAPNPMVSDDTIINAIAKRGWLGFAWPEELGGRKASLAEQVVLSEETTYNRVPASKALSAVTLLGSSIIRHGSQAQKDKFLPLIKEGKINFCLGYSEPEAGSDLASLRTKAVRDGDDWVINGQKLWTTNAHKSEWVWLAVRTDPDAKPKQAGITMFLFSLNTPGITIQQHTALTGEVSCSVFYDNVRVPDSARVGEVNGGWKVIVNALAGERISMGNIAATLRRQLDDLLDHVRSQPGGADSIVGGRGSAKRALVNKLAVRVQATRGLVGAAVKASSSDVGAMFDAPMAGVMGGDLAEDFGEAMLDLLGPVAALSAASVDAVDIPGSGTFEYGLRQSIMYVVGGGTNDVQRGLISRGLGLPR